MSHRLRLAVLALVLSASTAPFSITPCSMAFGDDPNSGGRTLTGKDAFGDWTTDAPGVRRKVTVDDLAQPYDTPSVENIPRVVRRPEGAWPECARRLRGDGVRHASSSEPRVIVRAPNGDLFLAESRANRVRVFRDADGDGKPEVNRGLRHRLEPAVRHRLLPGRPRAEVSSTSVTPTPWSASRIRTATRRRRAKPEKIIQDIPSGNERVGGGGHWTRDLEFSPDGKTLYVSVGSRSNVDDDERENAPG